MATILINYNFSDTPQDSLKKISGTDGRNLWCALLIKKLLINGNKILFPSNYDSSVIVDLEIHVNSGKPRSSAKKKIGLFMETPEIAPQNTPRACEQYDSVISWDPELQDLNQVVHSHLPCWDEEEFVTTPVKISHRPRTFSMIAANKQFKHAVLYKDLYAERRKIIKFFEQNDPESLKLYGPGWEIRKEFLLIPTLQKAAKRVGASGNLKTYQGLCASKNEIIQKHTFNVCFENCVYPGYVSEKIFDAILGGAIPIYFGANNYPKHLEGTFLDASEFRNLDDLVDFCKQMEHKDLENIVKNGQRFLSSHGKTYSHQSYCKTIYATIHRLLLH